MVPFYVSRGIAKGSVEKSDLGSWPSSIQEEFLSTVSIEEERGGRIYFRALEGETFGTAMKRLKDKMRARARSKRRAERLLIESEGIYEKEDLEELFEAQDGWCYYSGADLTWSPKNFSIDHVVPVMEGGTSWPGNLVLCLSDLNIEKGLLSRQKFFQVMKARFGVEWYESHKPFLRETDARRRMIDKRRRQAVLAHVESLADDLRSSFPDTIIDFRLEQGRPTLQIGYCEIRFPCGFLRQKRRFNSLQHIKNIVSAIVASESDK